MGRYQEVGTQRITAIFYAIRNDVDKYLLIEVGTVSGYS